MKSSFQRIFGFGEDSKNSELKTDKDGENHEEVRLIPVSDIVPNPFQPRTIFDTEKIEELARTIHTHGILQPIVVRIRDGQYELIAGERRLRAVKQLEWTEVPAIIKEFNDAQTASLALIENLQREELTVIEEARAYKQLIEWHTLTQESLAQRLGKGQSTIANKLRLLSLPEEVQTALLNRQISERHARALIRLKDEQLQQDLLLEIIEHDYNVKATEEAALRLLEEREQEEQPAKEKKKARKQHFPKDMRIAMNTIRESLSMVEKSGMSVDSSEEEHDDYYQFTIRIPKK
ncbi:chromosome (plasmid) partitioning protein ParB [Geomicrobium sp. JCM 19037]|uniref:nucleoid occlusion protein n=1 Tax=unclassified Geomicrobium TaxID=2628951 RepID=UPI00045F22A6|nr:MULTISPECIES: nucleoid occlusion protein [unclassified Geomicrobium]GAK04823.1 chromosome (plasmid) partitioning protein ParB [Geomicrobium sp. JCM 19037]GAK11993.1 chromosome (plasmid) partitioning protein ParB [Geomicrobium sp. JCM 19039]